MTLAVIETHPVQYHAPVYRALQREFGVPVTAIYASDFSVVGYRDAEFAASFAWDTDLLSGYDTRFLARVAHGGARSPSQVSTRGLSQALRATAPDAILLVGYSPRFYQLAFLKAWRTGRPLLLRAETTDHASVRTRAKRQLRDALLRWLYGRCDRLLYVGRQSGQHFRRLGCPEQKLVFSPYCVDTGAFDVSESARAKLRSAARTALDVDPSHRVVLLSGKLVPRKRADLLLKAVKLLPDGLRQTVHVVAIGSGQQCSALHALASEPPAVTASFVGFQNQSRLSAFYHAADLLVLPSESDETWGLVVNEALHHGLPCVVSDAVGSAPDLIEPRVTGDVFAAGSADGLAAALMRVWPMMGRETVRDACRRKVSGYSVARAAEGIARAYAEVARG